MDNPSYDPNLYQNFVPQDSVQQYVTSYGGPYAPGGEVGGIDGFGGGAGGAGAAVGVGFPIGGGGGGVGFPGNYPMGGIPYGPGGIPYGPGFGPAGFSVQSGYEGFLVPSVPPPPPPLPYGGGAIDVLRTILPRSISIFMRSGSYLLQTIAVILFGGAVTTAICTLTPLCTISFAALPFLGLRNTVKNVKDTLTKEVTTDRVARAAEFVQNALIKYQNLQLEHTPVDPSTKELTTAETPKSD